MALFGCAASVSEIAGYGIRAGIVIFKGDVRAHYSGCHSFRYLGGFLLPMQSAS